MEIPESIMQEYEELQTKLQALKQLKAGDKVSIKDYLCISNGSCIPIIRPAEIAWQPSEGAELIMVRFLDEKFKKGSKSNPIQVLSKNIVTD